MIANKKNKDAEKVWNAFKQMKTYLDKSVQILCSVDDKNYYTNKQGKKMYDGISTLLNTNIGHSNKEMIETISNQLSKLDNTTLFTSTSDVSIECSKKICSLTKEHFYSSFFTNSGSESCDTAIKIVRKYWSNKKQDKNGIVSLKGAYHGSSIGAMMLTNSGYRLDDYGLKSDEFYQVSCPAIFADDEKNMDSIIQYHINEFEDLVLNNKGKIGALFLELIQLSNGVNVLPVSYVQKLASICKSEDILLVIDEVATGFGRTGTMFSYEQYGIVGDLLMFAKGVTSGYFPMGGVLVTEEVYGTFWGELEEKLELCHGYTTGGHPVACAAAMKNIEIIERNDLLNNTIDMGTYLINNLREVCKECNFVKEVRGKGLMISIVFEKVKIPGMEQWGVADILSKLLATKGLLLYPDHDNVLIISPPLTIDTTNCNMITKIIADSLNLIKQIL